MIERIKRLLLGDGCEPYGDGKITERMFVGSMVRLKDEGNVVYEITVKRLN